MTQQQHCATLFPAFVLETGFYLGKISYDQYLHNRQCGITSADIDWQNVATWRSLLPVSVWSMATDTTVSDRKTCKHVTSSEISTNKVCPLWRHQGTGIAGHDVIVLVNCRTERHSLCELPAIMLGWLMVLFDAIWRIVFNIIWAEASPLMLPTFKLVQSGSRDCNDQSVLWWY